MSDPLRSIVILISGQGSNMEAILSQARDGILRDCCRILAVISNDPQAEGLKRAARWGVPTAVVPSEGRSREAFEAELMEIIDHYQPNLVVLAGFMRILSPTVVRHFRGSIVNIHPADTDLYRGAHGYEWAWRTQRTETTITIHWVNEGVDSGPVIARQTVDLCGVDSLEEVRRRGLSVEHELYSQALRTILLQRESFAMKGCD